MRSRRIRCPRTPRLGGGRRCSRARPGSADRRPLTSTTSSDRMTSPSLVLTPVTWGIPVRAEAPAVRPATLTPRRTSTPGDASAAAASTASTRTRRPVSHSNRSSPSCQPPVILGGITSRMMFSRSAPASCSAVETPGSSASSTARNPPRNKWASLNWFSPGRCQVSQAARGSLGGPSGSRSRTVTRCPSPARSMAAPRATTPPPTSTIRAMIRG